MFILSHPHFPRNGTIRSAEMRCQHYRLGTFLQHLRNQNGGLLGLLGLCKPKMSQPQHDDAFLMVGRAPSMRWVLVIFVGSALSCCMWLHEAAAQVVLQQKRFALLWHIEVNPHENTFASHIHIVNAQLGRHCDVWNGYHFTISRSLSQNLPNNYHQTDNSNALMRPPKIGKNWFNTNGNCGCTGTDAGFCTFYFSEMIGFSSKNNGYEKLCEKNVLCRKKVFGRLQISPPIIAKNVFYYRGKTVLASKGGLSFFSCSMRGSNNAPINLHTQMLAPWMMFTSTCIQMGWHATSCYICNGCHVTWRTVTYPRDVTLNGHSPQGMLACETGTLADTHFVSERASAKN